MSETLLIYFCVDKMCFVLGNDRGHEIMKSADATKLARYCESKGFSYELEGNR